MRWCLGDARAEGRPFGLRFLGSKCFDGRLEFARFNGRSLNPAESGFSIALALRRDLRRGLAVGVSDGIAGSDIPAVSMAVGAADDWAEGSGEGSVTCSFCNCASSSISGA